MKEQFTQGEWSFETNESYIELHADDKQIGDLAMGSNTCTETEVIANAHLIAASKKMYRLLEDFSKMVMPTAGELYAKCEEAARIIAEARGENNEHSN